MKLFNTASRSIEEFRPLQKDTVLYYSCGPTVYDYAQLGNWRSFVFADTLKRAIKANGFEVKHVMNITDVGHLTSDADEGQDKLEAGAIRENKTVWEIADYYINDFVRGAKLLNILAPNGYKKSTLPYARATDFIDEQIDIIKILLKKDLAYQTKQAIYFNTAKSPSYGELNGQDLSDKELASRDEVVTDSHKINTHDFALWFFTIGRFSNHQMHWSSPWGEGFPGWHLECSAIIHATLGDPIDIHSGGVDHIGTHHPNEIAQTSGAYGNNLANFWVHHEFLLVNGKKMSKSLGNFLTLKDIISRGVDPLALRLLFLQTHYRSQMNFTWDSLAAAASFYNNLRAMAALQHQPSESDDEQLTSEILNKYRLKILDKISDDLNTAAGLAVLSELSEQVKKLNYSEKQLPNLVKFLSFLDSIFGLKLAEVPDINIRQKDLILKRKKARQDLNWNESDVLRNQLLDEGIILEDTKSGTKWSYKI